MGSYNGTMGRVSDVASKKDLLAQNEELLEDVCFLNEKLGDALLEIDKQESLLRAKHDRITDLIGEVDRLTMTYEPYEPEGLDEDYYELLDAVNVLRAENQSLRSALINTSPVPKASRIRSFFRGRKAPRKNASITLDLWPLRDWFRFSYSPWNPGKYAQLCVGPVRIDFFAG